MNQAVFGTVAKDNLSFWRDRKLDYRKVVDFLEIDKGDISRFSGVAKSSVRYDQNMPTAVRQHLEQVANICNLVFEYFQDDVKTKLWFQTPNPMLGNFSPRDMIRFGRFDKLRRFVVEAIAEGRGSEALPGEEATTSS